MVVSLKAPAFRTTEAWGSGGVLHGQVLRVRRADQLVPCGDDFMDGGIKPVPPVQASHNILGAKYSSSLDLLLARHGQEQIDPRERHPVDELLPVFLGVPDKEVGVGAEVHQIRPRHYPFLGDGATANGWPRPRDEEVRTPATFPAIVLQYSPK